jgi:hypothetical protein
VQLDISACPTEARRNIISSRVSILNVERLMQVADEVENEHECFFADYIVGIRMDEELGLIQDC